MRTAFLILAVAGAAFVGAAWGSMLGEALDRERARVRGAKATPLRAVPAEPPAAS